MTDSKFRVALVGCGRVSGRHVQALREHASRAELVAVCDVDEDALRETVRRVETEGFFDYEEMLHTVTPDVVVLATPSGLHAAQAMEAARAGCHVVTEKPMATRWDRARDMVRVCDEEGVRLFVVKQHRFNPVARMLRRAVASGRFGRVYTVALNLFWSRPQSYYDLADWRGTWELDGGALMNQGIHYVDLLQWIFGPVESVHAFTSTLARRIEVEDTAVVNLRWRSGALGTIGVTMLTQPENFEASITVIGERGTVRLGGVACDRVEHWEFEDAREDDDAVATLGGFADDSVYGDGHAAYYENVLDALSGEGEPAVDGAEGLESLEIVAAAYRSAQERSIVSLPLT